MAHATYARVYCPGGPASVCAIALAKLTDFSVCEGRAGLATVGIIGAIADGTLLLIIIRHHA